MTRWLTGSASLLLVAAWIVPTPGSAQARGGGPASPVVVSPEVGADRRITVRLHAPKAQEVYATLAQYAMELKPTVKSPEFEVPAAWREEYYRRLQAAGVTIDKQQYDQAAP